MSRFRLKTTECRVGVVGLYNAGKTVLLTSLINHLENHDSDRFPLGPRGTTLRKFTPEPLDRGWASFNYTGFRDALVHNGRWPEKTRDRSAYACRFERSDWTFSDVLLKLYDLPGERLADAAMLNVDFAEWSDTLLHRVKNDTPYRTCCEPYLNATRLTQPKESELLHAYKLSLANLILAYKPLVSPSTFLLDAQGQAAKPDTAENLATSRHCGLDAGREFAPLPRELRRADPDLARAFADRFEQYKVEMVQPFLSALRSCNSLIVLVDVMMLLAGGVGMYDDNRLILQDLFRVLDPGENAIQTVGRHLAKVFLPHELRPGWIHRVAFVAPKLDLVHPVDRDRMLIRDGLQARFFNCASVVSTKVLPGSAGERLLVGVPYRDSSGKRMLPGPEQRFVVSALPDDWPADWAPGRFAYPEVYPTVPTRKDCPPDQINLNAVLDFVLD
jgi:predicted YcjX-like family ATPase